ncbi:hypothetical protein Pmar_PMAR018836, partial [Perkinsus marinus ATCC 50983]
IMEGRDRHDRSIYDNLAHEPSGSFPSQVDLTDSDPLPSWWNDDSDELGNQ